MPDDLVIANLRTAAEALERGQTLAPFQLTKEAEIATRGVARARDILIVRLREAGEGANSTSERFLLDEVNALLSQCIAIQSPAAGVNREEIKKTRDALVGLVKAHESQPIP